MRLFKIQKYVGYGYIDNRGDLSNETVLYANLVTQKDNRDVKKNNCQFFEVREAG